MLYRFYSVLDTGADSRNRRPLIHWEEQGRSFRQFLLEVVLVSLLAVIPALLIGQMVSHRFLEQFVGQTGQQQTLKLLNQILKAFP